MNDAERTAAGVLGYTKDRWDSADQEGAYDFFEGKSYDSLNQKQQEAMEILGFDKSDFTGEDGE